MFSFGKKNKRRKECREIVRRLKHYLLVNDDIIDDDGREKLLAVIEKLQDVNKDNIDAMKAAIADCDVKLAKLMPKKSFPILREWADIIAVAMCVAFGVRALFLQPFKIPTSSMQPTLFGIHYIDKQAPAGPPIPENMPGIADYCVYAAEKAEAKTERGGLLGPVLGSFTKYLLLPWTRFTIGDETHDLPGAPTKVADYAIKGQSEFKPGQTLCDGWLALGDHLFVNRFSHHFKELERGDIIVFNTEGIIGPDGVPLTERGYYYVKRLVGLPGDTIAYRDGMLYIKPENEPEFKPVTEFGEAFEKIYSFQGGYHGYTPYALFSGEKGMIFTIPEDRYFALGDNSAHSSDSRYWGFVPRANIVGTAFIVFWPYSRRWGLADTDAPLPHETKMPEQPSMHWQ